MTGRYRVSLNNVQLDSLDKDLLILDVSYSTVGKQVTENSNANLNGYEIVRTYYDRQTVTVSFELHIYDVAKRNEACQKINAWAIGGGILRVNDRAKQYLSVVCRQTASIGSVRNWTDPLTIVFETTVQPFWQADSKNTLTITGSNPSGVLSVGGNIGDALVSVTATAKSAVSSCQIRVGETTIRLMGISVPANKNLVIDYINDRYVRIMANGLSVLSRLDPASSDNLRAPCGKKTNVSASASGSMSFVFTARGLFV